MHPLFSSFLIFLCLSLFQSSEKMHNIDYLSKGYDIILGNPNPASTPNDPGLKDRKIFSFTYADGVISDDGRFEYPDDIIISKEEGCALDLQSTVITSDSDYKSSLDNEVGFNIGFFHVVSFSASVDYHKIQETTQNHSTTYFTGTSSCYIYSAAIDSYILPKFDSLFIKRVDILPLEYDEGFYMDFITDFGTHYFSKLVMGAKFGFLSSISQNSYYSFVDEGVNVKTAAEFSFIVSAGFNTSTTTDQVTIEKFSKEVISQHEISIGSRPPADGNPATWANNCGEEPMPIHYEVKTIDSLLKDDFPSNNITIKRTNLQKALQDYCSHLNATGYNVTCLAPTPDQPAAKKSGSCKLCANTCGGTYTIETGTFAADSNIPEWAYIFDPNCEGSADKRPYPLGIKMCCEPENDIVQGSCEICASCGGTYSYEEGSVMVGRMNWENWIKAYDDQCSGDLRSRKTVTPVGFKMCCSEPDVCTYCSQCGGDFPKENGVLSVSENLWEFFSARGPECAGYVYPVDSYFEGIKLCCKN